MKPKEHYVDRPLISSAKAENSWIFTSLSPVHRNGAVLRRTGKLTFNLVFNVLSILSLSM